MLHTLIVFLICAVILFFLNQIFDGVFKDWVYNTFTRYQANGLITLNWNLIQKLIVIFILIIIPLFYLLGTKLFNKKISSLTKEKTKNEIVSLLSNPEEAENVQKEYPEVFALLKKMEIEKKYQEELLEKENKRKNDLITYLAHDLKTPLASTIGYLSFLEDAEELSKEEQKKFVKIALEKAYRLEELIEQFFDITRFNLQNISIQKEKINIELLLEQVADEFYPIAEKQNKKIHLEVQNKQDIYADSDKFGRVLTNVLKNALAYSYQDSTIEIIEYMKENSLYIQIINEGDTIPEHKLQMIFESFYRLDSARTSNKGGTGLGLAIAKEIMKAHGGSVEVESINNKTTFTISLPATEKNL